MENYSKEVLTAKDKRDNAVANTNGIHSIEDERDDKGLLSGSLTKRLFLTGEQWSQEENSEDVFNEVPSVNNSFSSCPSYNEENLSTICNKPFNHNNNLIEEKSNLTCSDDKSCCFYRKFPLKVNNNIYSEKSILKNDGMDEYFKQHSSTVPCDTVSNIGNSVCNGSISSTSNLECVPHLNIDNTQCNIDSSFDDRINALNGEEEDEDDGCIYTYKGDNFEANLSHLLDTCFSCGLPTNERSGTHHGAVSIQRILNGSPHPNPNPHGNSYSPEMDFLEMDFDPGSNGDGPDSDCEDNSVLNIDAKFDSEKHLESLSKLDTETKTHNIPNEIRSLMCRRCEMCMYNDKKVNNTSNMISKPEDNKLSNSSYSVLDIRLADAGSINSTKDLNFKVSPQNKQQGIKNSFINLKPKSPLLHNLFVSDDNSDSNKKDTVENNLNVLECEIQEFSDGGEEADDEDDSTSEQPFRDASQLTRRNSSSSFFNPLLDNSNLRRFCTKSNGMYERLSKTQNDVSNNFTLNQNSRPNKVCIVTPNVVSAFGKDSKIANHIYSESNNNLGSISAPEVSPAKEFTPLEKFSRSVSFHNQLSIPKYENVCFTRHKDNITSSNEYQCSTNCSGSEYCNCKFGYNSKQSARNTDVDNMEACLDRLNQREKSVFNIANSSKDTDFSKCQPSSPKFSNTVLQIQSYGAADGSHNNCTQLRHPALIASPKEDRLRPMNYEGLLQESDSFDDSDEHLLGPLSPLPVKTIQPKVDDPSRDPNTATSDDDLASSPTAKDDKKLQIQKVMIWTERQATCRQVVQIAKSACGATAVINVLLALDQQRPIETVTSAIRTRLRAEDAGLVDYILSRSKAGATHKDLIDGIEIITEKSITGRFFHMYPKRSFQLSRWLSHWIRKGGVPLATFNLQVGVHPRQTIPDCWHHQMVFGVGPQGIYLTNPLECVSDSLLSEQLCSDSVLLVRRSDIVSRWDMKDKLIRLSLQPDPRWNDMTVLGQVVGVLKEHTAPEMLQGRRHLTSHVAIPAAYQSGISIFMRADNPFLTELTESPELPLLDE